MATLLGRPLTQPIDPGAPPPELPYAMADQMQQGPISPMALMPSARPQVSGPDEQQQMINHDQQQLQKVQWHQSHGWGQPGNHDTTMGKIAHVLSVAGNIAGNIVAPNVMANIPGTQLNMQEQEGGLAKQLNAEVGDESQNQARNAETALKAQEPEIAQAKQSLAQEKQDETENHHQAQIDEHMRTAGFKKDEQGNIVPDEESLPYQKQKAANDIAHSTIELRKAQTEFEQMKGDPNSVQNQQIGQRLAIAKQTQDRMTGMMGAMQERADAQMINAKAGAYGVGMDNKPLPGAMVTDEGQPVGSHFQSNVRPTGAQRGKGNMAESADQQINDMKSIVSTRPDVFGPVAGRKTDFSVWVGSQDPDAQRFRAARTIAGDHLAGTFGGRSETALAALDSAIGHFKDNPAAVTAGLNQLQEANRLFLEAGKVKTVGSHTDAKPQGGGMMRAIDPKGVLHEAPAGTPLPAGWKAQ